MTFEDVHLISEHVEPIRLSEVEQAERHFGFKLPSGYTQFITRFGLGVYCDLFHIYAPNHILEEYANHRAFWKEWYYPDTQGKQHWFFEGSDEILSESQLQECIILGDTKDGDELVFHPAKPDRVYILPRHSDKITSVKADFTDLHLWDKTSPLLQTFAPWLNQTTMHFRSTQFSLVQTECLEQFKRRWGSENLLMKWNRSDDWSWGLVFFVPPIGGRVQIIQDEGVTRTYQNESGGTVTRQGGGQRSLDVTIYCDDEAVKDVNAFLVSLEAANLCQWQA